MMGFRMAVRGDIRRVMEAEKKAGAGAVTSGIRRRTIALQRNIRRQIEGAGLGSRLPKTIRAAVYPERKESLSAKGRVQSNALYKKRPGGLVDLITVFDEGATVRAQGGKFLIVQLGTGAQSGAKQRAKAPTIDPRTMAIIPLRSGKGFLVVRRDTSAYRRRSGRGYWGEPLYLLIPQVTVRKRLDLDSLTARAWDGLPELIVREWERRSAKIAG